MSARIIQIVAGIAGLCALGLGLAFWIARIELISIHMLFGLIVALALLVISILVVRTASMRIWGSVGIVYALVVPIFGITQASILPGDSHWIIRTLHLLVGIGAMVLAGIMGTRYMAVSSASAGPAARKQEPVGER